jgi:hypothetical protein
VTGNVWIDNCVWRSGWDSGQSEQSGVIVHERRSTHYVNGQWLNMVEPQRAGPFTLSTGTYIGEDCDYIGLNGTTTGSLGNAGTFGLLANTRPPTTTAWAASTAQTVGNVIVVGGHTYQVSAVTGDNKTGATIPATWNTTGGTTTDNHVTWQDNGPFAPVVILTNCRFSASPAGTKSCPVCNLGYTDSTLGVTTYSTVKTTGCDYNRAQNAVSPGPIIDDPTAAADQSGNQLPAKTDVTAVPGEVVSAMATAPVGSVAGAVGSVTGTVKATDQSGNQLATATSSGTAATDVKAIVGGLLTSTSGIGTTPAEIDAELSAAHGAGPWGPAVGPGAIQVPITVEDTAGNPLPNVLVWITSDVAGADTVAGPLTTGATGQVIFMLAAGTWYVWRQAAGLVFATNPQAITVA